MDYKPFVHLFMDNYSDLLQRLHFVMDGREKYPWGTSIGLGKGVIDGMTRTGSIPGGETLAMIRKCENVRIDWLLDGTGHPYITSRAISDQDAQQILADLTEENWTIYYLRSDSRIALVLTQPQQFSVKDGKNDDGSPKFRWNPCTAVEIVVGQIGAGTLALARNQPWPQKYVEISAQQMDQLEKGQVGTYKLIRTGGILAEAVSEEPDSEFLLGTGAADSHLQRSDTQTPAVGETELLDSYHQIPVDQRSLALTVIRSIANHFAGTNSV